MIIHIYDSGIMSAFVEIKSFLVYILLDNLQRREIKWYYLKQISLYKSKLWACSDKIRQYF